jgi:hypothetical protein
MRTWGHRVSRLVACLAVASCALRAPQATPPARRAAAASDTPQRPCTETIPDKLLTDSQTVYLHAFLLDTSARTLMPQADLLAQRVAHRLRLSLGGRADSVPWGGPVITWRNNIRGNLAVIIHRDGRLTWQELLPMPIPDTLPTSLVARALDAVIEHGEAVAWTSEAVRDSLVVRLALDDAAEAVYATAVGLGFPVFKLRRPVMTMPELVSHPPLRYPTDLREANMTGSVVMEAMVDTTGRPEPATIHDLWPAGRRPPEGEQLFAYRAFAEAAAEAIAAARFLPGRIGGCAVRTRVQVPVNFGISGAP